MRLKAPIVIVLTTLHILAQSQVGRQLIDLGFTESDLELSSKLNGQNPKNDILFIVKSADVNTESKIWSTEYSYFLIKSNNLVEITDLRNKLTPDLYIIYFEIQDSTLFVVSRKISLRRTFHIHQFNLSSGHSIFEMKGEQPCAFREHCEWINYEEKELAIFSSNAVYTYGWKDQRIQKIGDVSIHGIDAMTGSNMNLRSVTFNEEKGQFEYGQ